MKKQASMFLTLVALVFTLSALAQKPASPPAKAEGSIDGVKVTVD